MSHKQSQQIAPAAALFLVFAFGLAVGRFSGPAVAQAQEADGPVLSENSANEINAAGRALSVAREQLTADGLYNAAATPVNPFLILSGGGDAVADLEAGQGVDPETFAALYAGRATDEVKAKLTRSDDGHLLYDGVMIRMYPIEKLENMYAQREQLQAGEGF